MNKKVALSVLSTAVVASMAASAFAAPLEGVYVGGNVKKYYHTDTLFEMTKDARAQYKAHLKAVGEENIVFVDHKGKGASIQEIFDKGKSKAFEEQLKKEDFADLYQVVKPDGTTSGTEDAKSKVDPATGDLKVESVSAITKTKVEVKFNKAVDSIKAENFTIAGASVNAAKLSEDKKTVTLTVSGLAYSKEYTVATKQVLVDGKAVDLADSKFTTPAVTDVYKLELTTNALGDQVLANGSDNLVITAKLLDKVTGQVDVNADNVVIAFSTTYGNLANTRVTVQNGVATVTLRSEFSQKDLVSKVDAQIIEASGDYKDLIGKVVGTKEVYFKVKLDDLNPETKPAVVSAGSNQADRVTVNFNKDVTVADFVQYDETTKKYKTQGGNALLVAGTTIKVSQPGEEDRTVLGLKPVAGNSKALEVVLAKGSVLKDNKNVKVEVTQASNVGPQTTSADFILADARKPEATSVVAQDLKTIKVKFSEAISTADVSLDGGLTAVDTANTAFGDFNPETLEDTRDLLTVKTVNYLTAGIHSVQLSSISDFAGLSDDKNISTSQTLDFKVDGDDSIPSSTVSVESPEQFRVVFNKQITGLNTSNVKLQVAVRNADGTEEWKNVEDTNKYAITPTVAIDPVSESEYVVELKTDWTKIYNTKSTTKNYYNDKYRLFIPAKSVVNPANGKQNADIVMLLNDPIMASADTVSPAIKDITEISVGHYNVAMTKPVKLPGQDKTGDDILDTESENQVNGVPTPIVEFLGKDKDGNAVTIKGTYVKYTDKNKADKEFEVVPTPEPGKEDPQTIVNNGGDTNWTLIVRSISDDVGSTTNTLTKQFVIRPTTVVTDDVFLVKGKTANDPNYNGVHGYLNGTGKDTIELTFTSGVQYTGTDKNAVNPGNYTLDGEDLPKGTLLKVEDADNNTKNGYEKVVITLPDGTLGTSKGNNVITLSKSLKSYKETVLTGEYNISFVPELGVEPADAEAAKAVDTQIAALPANITLQDEKNVNDARTAFNNLTDAQKALVKNKATLEAAEKKIADLKKADGDAAANLKAAQDAVAALETAAAADLKVEANLIKAEEAVKTAEAAVTKVGAGADKDLLAAKVTLAKKTVADARKAFDTDSAATLKAAQDAVAALEAAAGKDLKVEANLTAAETALADANAKVAKVATGADKTALEGKVTAAEKTVTDARKAFDDAKALEAAKTALNDAVVAAQAKHDAAAEGNASGEYPAPAKANFQTAITAAKGVHDNATSTKAELDQAKADLATAETAFDGLKTP
ncbi:sugar-binding domain protein [Brevibacillus brevis]|uniref:sugar-binding domain protein n=1 Tax=Brevibacillus brevis TaxID=1393 RepID=UPI00289993FD|nr:sugar-binding domain protein [Brevibacillus brevis]